MLVQFGSILRGTVTVPYTIQANGKTKPAAAQDRKKRLAGALRRNLAKRKDKKETNPESKPQDD
jgi:hypothetical protein